MFYNVPLKLPFEVPFVSQEKFDSIFLRSDIDYGHDIPLSYVSDEAKQFFLSKGMRVVGAEFFDFSSYFVQGIHVDGPVICDKIKFNWAYGGAGHKFNFYSVNDNWSNTTDESVDSQDKHNHTSLTFLKHEVTVEDSNPISLPSLCCVGRPHNIVNAGERLKLFNITVSLIDKPFDPGTGNITMQEAMEILHEYILPKT